MGKNTKLTHNS